MASLKICQTITAKALAFAVDFAVSFARNVNIAVKAGEIAMAA